MAYCRICNAALAGKILLSIQSIAFNTDLFGFRAAGTRYCMVHGGGEYSSCRQKKSDSFVAV
jgi:hypothetical protein